jgi:hypothetical protein
MWNWFYSLLSHLIFWFPADPNPPRREYSTSLRLPNAVSYS